MLPTFLSCVETEPERFLSQRKALMAEPGDIHGNSG
jgi:hypothetical protein